MKFKKKENLLKENNNQNMLRNQFIKTSMMFLYGSEDTPP